MTIVIGMDEAGYGPNLGPLVIAATAWRIDSKLDPYNLWPAIDGFISNNKRKAIASEKLFVADSKAVHAASQGIESLEKNVRPFFDAFQIPAETFAELCENLSCEAEPIPTNVPWYEEAISLPISEIPEYSKVRSMLIEKRVEPIVAATRLVFPEEFNRLVGEWGSKGVLLSRLSLQLLSTLWHQGRSEPVVVIGDKHGGRNRYDDLLQEIADDDFIFRIEEATARSHYRLGQKEVIFQTKAEAHFPVALSSMMAKYLRELAMESFNRFWKQHQPDLKPTKGYPTDARRFRADIQITQKVLGIKDEMLWRNR